MDSQLFTTQVDPLTGRARFSVPSNGTSTSVKAAAKKARNGTAERDRRAILSELARHPLGLTREEIAILTGIRDSSVRPRVIDLLRGGAVYESGAERKTSTGNKAKVVFVTDAGRVRAGGNQ